MVESRIRRKPKPTLLARRLRRLYLEAAVQLDLFVDRAADAAKARAELDALHTAQPRHGAKR
jgi:hypothetical protein